MKKFYRDAVLSLVSRQRDTSRSAEQRHDQHSSRLRADRIHGRCHNFHTENQIIGQEIATFEETLHHLPVTPELQTFKDFQVTSAAKSAPNWFPCGHVQSVFNAARKRHNENGRSHQLAQNDEEEQTRVGEQLAQFELQLASFEHSPSPSSPWLDAASLAGAEELGQLRSDAVTEELLRQEFDATVQTNDEGGEHGRVTTTPATSRNTSGFQGQPRSRHVSSAQTDG